MAMTNKQPFYHRMEVLFTATSDVSEWANSEPFKKKLGAFLKKELGRDVLPETVQLDAPVDAEPGDPHDLVGG